ncbi:type IV pilin protein [Psychromonas sp. Urea-02u-13]|uniref:type IV pilin protein n=1 Tax=Psychromonas sp. Urea-02u-13 TaxID=2058326 RepID=UPI000C33370D|nr:type IV pilin protein [Psychromonas sp. Urea-02u-13]PKG40779.1 prepilin-type cleavage/methylation domain-containing protein [Psychromonas sp. Urea-02u-13]
MENKGFTLIELLIVIAIIGILVAIALPSYQAHVRKANRIDVQLAMTKMSLVAERQYARQGDYPADAAATGVELVDTYNTTFVPTVATNLAPASFIITATPSGGQGSDICGVMTLIQTGKTTATKGGSDVSDQCW